MLGLRRFTPVTAGLQNAAGDMRSSRERPQRTLAAATRIPRRDRCLVRAWEIGLLPAPVRTAVTESTGAEIWAYSASASGSW